MNTTNTLEYDKIIALLVQKCRTDGGRTLCASLLPSDNIVGVRRAQCLTTLALDSFIKRGAPPFSGVPEIADTVERAEKGAILGMGELLRVASSLRATRATLEYNRPPRQNTEFIPNALDEIFSRLRPNRPLEDAIGAAILSEDTMSDDASPRLSDIRRKIRYTSNKVRELLQRFVTGEHGKYLQDALVTTRGGRFVVPVKIEHKNEVKGLIHDISGSGATVFVEPIAVVEANNELRVLEGEEAKEIDKILAEFSVSVGATAEVLRYNDATLSELAFIFAKAEFSDAIRGVEPVINDSQKIELIKARHPLIARDAVVPISVCLGGAYTTLVVTGPNTGGKTVTLKTIGLLCLMSAAGLHIPAASGSNVCVFDRVFADIGDGQSVENSLSTFSSHMKNIVEITTSVTGRSLALFDELGAGTDPAEGAALAAAVLEHVGRRGSLCAATTHYAELKAYAIETAGVENASCEFDIETLRPTYRLIVGAPGKSNAFAISERLGLDKNIISAAASRVSIENKRFEAVVEKLDAARFESEREREAAASLRMKLEAELESTRKNFSVREEKLKTDIEKAKSEAAQIIRSAKNTAEFVFAELEKAQKQAARDAESAAEIKRGVKKALGEADASLDPVVRAARPAEYVLPRELRVGDPVDVIEIGGTGEIVTAPDKDGNVTVKIGNFTLRTSVGKLMLRDAAGEKKSAYIKPEYQTRKVSSRDIKIEIDIRGMTGDEGWRAVDEYLDDAVTANLKIARIIHGKGSGALRKRITEELKNDRRISGFRAGIYGEGDTGVTVVEMR